MLYRHNARIYNKKLRIETITCDIYDFIRTNSRSKNIDLVILSPPWGGIDYASDIFDMRRHISSGDGIELAQLVTSNICENIVYLLPKNLLYAQIYELQMALGSACLVESIHLFGKLKMIVLYLGPMFRSKRERQLCHGDPLPKRQNIIDCDFVP